MIKIQSLHKLGWKKTRNMNCFRFVKWDIYVLTTLFHESCPSPLRFTLHLFFFLFLESSSKPYTLPLLVQKNGDFPLHILHNVLYLLG
jgi:hypothetical protein